MGAIFRQAVTEMTLEELQSYANQNGLKLLGAALREGAEDIRKVSLKRTAVAIGSRE